jgi:hypothetical protein
VFHCTLLWRLQTKLIIIVLLLLQSSSLEIDQWRGFCYTYGHSGKQDKPQVLSVALSCSALDCNRGLVHYSAMLLQVGKQSKHCRACDICTEGFDHHCWVCVEVPRAPNPERPCTQEVKKGRGEKGERLDGFCKSLLVCTYSFSWYSLSVFLHYVYVVSKLFAMLNQQWEIKLEVWETNSTKVVLICGTMFVVQWLSSCVGRKNYTTFVAMLASTLALVSTCWSPCQSLDFETSNYQKSKTFRICMDFNASERCRLCSLHHSVYLFDRIVVPNVCSFSWTVL